MWSVQKLCASGTPRKLLPHMVTPACGRCPKCAQLSSRPRIPWQIWRLNTPQKMGKCSFCRFPRVFSPLYDFGDKGRPSHDFSFFRISVCSIRLHAFPNIICHFYLKSFLGAFTSIPPNCERSLPFLLYGLFLLLSTKWVQTLQTRILGTAFFWTNCVEVLRIAWRCHCRWNLLSHTLSPSRFFFSLGTVCKRNVERLTAVVISFLRTLNNNPWACTSQMCEWLEHLQRRSATTYDFRMSSAVCSYPSSTAYIHLLSFPCGKNTDDLCIFFASIYFTRMAR